MHRGKKMVLLGILLASMFGSALIGIASGQQTLELPAADFQLSPFTSTITDYDIIDAQSLNTLATLDGAQTYHDPLGKYPDVGVWISDPFFVTNDGNTYVTPEQYLPVLVDPATTMDFQFENGEHRFLKTINLGVDVVMRTYSNMIPRSYNTYYISPLIGYSAFSYSNVFARHVNNDWTNPAIAEEPYGVLLASLDTGVNPWQLKWELGANEETKAKITTSLENFNQKTEMDNNLRSKYGNSAVNIVPRVKLNAIEDLVFFNYYKNIEGNAFHIETTDCKMAIIDANLVSSISNIGMVKNYIEPSGYQAEMPTDFAQKPYSVNDDPRVSEVDAKYSTISQRSAEFSYVQTIADPTPITGDIRRPQVLADDAVYPTKLKLDAFTSLKTSVLSSFTTKMQPFTTVKYAQYRADYTGYMWNGNLFGAYSTTYSSSLYPTFPFQLTTENVYCIQRIKYTVLLATTNKVEYITATGVPEKVENIYDYGVSSAGFFNPTMDILKGSTLTINPTPFGSLLQWWDEQKGTVITIIILVIAGIVAVAVVIGLVKTKRIQMPGPERAAT